MNLADERLKGLDDPSLSADERALLRCRVVADLIHRGQYEAAREALGGLWRGLGERPDVEGLTGRAAGEVVLQAGALSGWIGGSRQIRGAQESAKDLISQSAALFEAAGEAERAAVARCELALCYWREGAYDEARVLLTDAFAGLEETAEKAKAVVKLATVEFSAGRHHDALLLLTEHAHIFDERVSHALRGSFHSHLALVFRRLGTDEGRADYFDRAIIEYTAAIHHFGEARHDRYRANNENNLAFLLYKLGRYRQAHEHLDRAGATLTRLKDAGLLAQVEETRARVFLAQRKYEEADRVISRAVQALEQGDRPALLADVLTTRGVVWARLGDRQRSLDALRRAGQVAEEAGALSNAGLAVLALIEEHGARRSFPHLELYELYQRADRLLQDTQHPETTARLRACALIVMKRLAGVPLGEKGFTLFKAVQEFEERIIEKALERERGSVTRAAKLLGIRHQTFITMLNSRHKKLLAKRTPPEKRLRSIIKEPKE
jgi:tetratricopeptide (TPR) repeat protein